MTQPTLGAPGSPDATVERVRYEHRASAEDRAASAQRAANKRMSDAHPELRQEAGTEEEHDAIEVRLVEEHADSAPADDPERRTRRAARRERRRLEKIAEQERKEKEAAQHLEDTARKMFYGGFFALPFLWLVSLIYFHKEHKAADANENIKKCASVPIPRVAMWRHTLTATDIDAQITSTLSLCLLCIQPSSSRGSSSFS